MNLKKMIGLGVAGNFAGHLEQAGEDADFVNVITASANAPKGIFPTYVPADTGQFISYFVAQRKLVKSGATS